MIVTKFQSFQSWILWKPITIDHVTLQLLSDFLTLPFFFVFIHLSLNCPFSLSIHSLYKPEIDQNVQPSMYNPQHWPEFSSLFFFPLLPLLHCSPVTIAPPLNSSPPCLSLSPLFSCPSPQWTHYIRWFCYFPPPPTAVCIIIIFAARHLFIRISLCENTCTQDGCFQGYRRGTK